MWNCQRCRTCGWIFSDRQSTAASSTWSCKVATMRRCDGRPKYLHGRTEPSAAGREDLGGEGDLRLRHGGRSSVDSLKRCFHVRQERSQRWVGTTRVYAGACRLVQQRTLTVGAARYQQRYR